jgi:hypothetical protein
MASAPGVRYKHRKAAAHRNQHFSCTTKKGEARKSYQKVTKKFPFCKKGTKRLPKGNLLVTHQNREHTSFEQKRPILSGASEPAGQGLGRRRCGVAGSVPAAIGFGAHRANVARLPRRRSSSLVIARLNWRPCAHCAAWATRGSLPAVASRTCSVC